MKRRILLSIFALFLVFGVTRLISSGFDSPRQKETATPVRLGEMSQKQKEHSELHSHKSAREKLETLVEKGTGDIEVIDGMLPMGAGPLDDDSAAVHPNPYLVGIAADAIVIGTIAGKSSQITGDGTFIFTDYDVAVEGVLKPNPQVVNSPTATSL